MHEVKCTQLDTQHLVHSLRKSPIPARQQQEILLDLCTVDRLRKTLDIVDIILGFLSSGGGNPGTPLGVYINNTLKMRMYFSEKVATFVVVYRELCMLYYKPTPLFETRDVA